PADSNHLVALSLLAKPSVSFLVARHGDAIVGCCALVEAGAGTAEIKRIFVNPAARGLRLASGMMNALKSIAGEKGLTA
ncbi:GNAT family N-acetyltransferase, partial [Rhizobium leguminosarum]|uniref:GNAT family N-acetyltransferase n=1 Tax=Rhizobium leguminosarum TaxID=384 RepID=UPI003F94F9A6